MDTASGCGAGSPSRGCLRADGAAGTGAARLGAGRGRPKPPQLPAAAPRSRTPGFRCLRGRGPGPRGLEPGTGARTPGFSQLWRVPAPRAAASHCSPRSPHLGPAGLQVSGRRRRGSLSGAVASCPVRAGARPGKEQQVEPPRRWDDWTSPLISHAAGPGRSRGCGDWSSRSRELSGPSRPPHPVRGGDSGSGRART